MNKFRVLILAICFWPLAALKADEESSVYKKSSITFRESVANKNVTAHGYYTNFRKKDSRISISKMSYYNKIVKLVNNKGSYKATFVLGKAREHLVFERLGDSFVSAKRKNGSRIYIFRPTLKKKHPGKFKKGRPGRK